METVRRERKEELSVGVAPITDVEIAAIVAISDIKRVKSIIVYHFNEFLKAKNHERGMIEAIALGCGFHSSNVSAIKAGNTSLTYDSAEQLAYILSCREPGRGESFLSELFKVSIGERLYKPKRIGQPKDCYLSAINEINYHGLSACNVRDAVGRGGDYHLRAGSFDRPRIQTMIRVYHSLRHEDILIADKFLTDLMGRKVGLG